MSVYVGGSHEAGAENTLLGECQSERHLHRGMATSVPQDCTGYEPSTLSRYSAKLLQVSEKDLQLCRDCLLAKWNSF